ncbi:hypothetical protein K469DRAFT_683909 [Zopfia rhizophila CBS 207.26]|uniref:Uncharacterized protein n=1 Tax=Zopfia rhizophila CBS 207.26 TaxID=1314779 RepID=A0A6A6D7V0_9PEZI|nr:hypothetical protein K469DRAFT_683909 [Zopfia rhizophila CBS 207.26]
MARTKGAKAIPKTQRAALVAIDQSTAKKHIAAAKAQKVQNGPGFNIYEDPDDFNHIKQPGKPELLPEESKPRMFEHAPEDKENAEKPRDIIAEETHDDFVSYSTIKKAFYDEGYH